MNSLKKLFPYLKPYRWLILGSALLAIPLAAIRMGPAPLVKYLVDDLIPSGDTRKLKLFPFFVIGLFLVNFVVRFFHYYMLRIVIARVNQKIKNDIYDHFMGLSADYFTSQSTGSLISRVGSDPQHIDGALSCINVILREPVTFLLLLSYALHLNWKLTLVTFLVFPPLAIVFRVTGKNLKRYIARMNEENAKLFSTLQESFTGVRIVKMFGLEKILQKKFQDQSGTFTRYLLKTAVLEEAAHPMVELLTAFAIAGVLYFGGIQVLKGQMTPGGLTAFFAAFAMMMNPLRLMNDVSIKLHSAAAACERIFDALSWKSRVVERVDAVSKKTFVEAIRLENVSFAYPDLPERKVLSNVTLHIPKKTTVALVGASGSGKSSLVQLLPRIFDITQGSIQIDGTDIRDVQLDDLRNLIAVVSQDVFLFNDSILENIRFGRPSATDADVRQAAQKAHALDFVDRMSEGMKTVVGDRGQKLSGGERQRISIARAFLRNSPILLLDEATSSLDTASEKAVQAALEELMKDKTCLVIAHRLSTIRHADLIYVIEDGKIVETGKHEDLIKNKGAYARFNAMA